MLVPETPMAKHQLDITGEVCPMTFVRVKLRLETLEHGDELEVLLKGAEPLRNVPKSVVEEGHEILALTTSASGVASLHIRAQLRFGQSPLGKDA
jgi:tRNA 2-thiouridine synthesizing protein A